MRGSAGSNALLSDSRHVCVCVRIPVCQDMHRTADAAPNLALLLGSPLLVHILFFLGFLLPVLPATSKFILCMEQCSYHIIYHLIVCCPEQGLWLMCGGSWIHN